MLRFRLMAPATAASTTGPILVFALTFGFSFHLAGVVNVIPLDGRIVGSGEVEAIFTIGVHDTSPSKLRSCRVDSVRDG